MYDIDFAKKLDEGTAGVSIKGKIVFSLAPKNIVSEPNAQKQFNFWSQFIAIEDKTGSIGANITFGEEKDKKVNGEIVEIKGTIHKYEAINKKTGQKEEKIVLNNAKVIEPEKPKEETKTSPKEKPSSQVTNNNTNLKMNEKDIRKEAAIIAFNYGAKEGFSIYDCFDLSGIIGTYIKSGEVDIKEILPEKKLEIKSKIKEKPESKETDEKKLKNIMDIAKKADLDTWGKIAKFAIESEIFGVDIKTEEIKTRLCKIEALYDALIEALNTRKDIVEDVKNRGSNEEATEEIPF